MIRFRCPICHATLSVPEDKAGKKGSCPKCGQRLMVPAPQRRKTVLGEPISPQPQPVTTAIQSQLPPEADGESSDEAYSEDYEDTPRLPQSGLGLASCILAGTILIINCMCFLLVAVALTSDITPQTASQGRHAGTKPSEGVARAGAMAQMGVCVNCLGVVGLLVGIGLGVGGMFQANRRREMALVGLVANAFLLLILFALAFLAMSRPPA